MSYDARQVANFIIDFCENNGRNLTNLSLQKIVYFCHAWSLVELDRPLIRQAFEAWRFGPVIQHLYHDFKRFDRSPITEKARRINVQNGNKEVVSYDFDAATEELLRRVADFYTKVPAGDLVEMTHAPGGPWDKVWNHEEATNPGMKIKDHDIRAYHSKVRRGTSGSH